jgi:hypothetical protein
MHRLLLALIILAASGLIAAGCGDDDDGGDSGGSNAPAEKGEAAPADTGTTTEEEDVGGSATEDEPAGEDQGSTDVDDLDADSRKAAAEACKQSVSSAQQLSGAVKEDLEEICEKAAAGDEDAVQEASREVCKRIVEDSVPAGPQRDQAITACDQAGQ